MKKLAAGVVLGAVTVTAGAVFTASKADDELVRQMRDRLEIEELMWRYTRALDTGDAEAYASVYTPDGQFSAGGTATKGRAALKAMIAGTAQRQAAADSRRPPMFHATANHRITFLDRNHARIDAYHITGVAGAGRERPPRLAGIGRSIDELERVDGRWLIASRNVAPID